MTAAILCALALCSLAGVWLMVIGRRFAALAGTINDDRESLDRLNDALCVALVGAIMALVLPLVLAVWWAL